MQKQTRKYRVFDLIESFFAPEVGMIRMIKNASALLAVRVMGNLSHIRSSAMCFDAEYQKPYETKFPHTFTF